MPANVLFLPSDVQVFTEGGTGNLDHQFYLDGGIDFALVFVRCHFAKTGLPAVTWADFFIRVDSDRGIWWDTDLMILEDRGADTGGAGYDRRDVNFRVPQDELIHWKFSNSDRLWLYWLNPSVLDQISWGVEVGLLDATYGQQIP